MVDTSLLCDKNWNRRERAHCVCPQVPDTVQDNTILWLAAFGELEFLALNPTFAIHLM